MLPFSVVVPLYNKERFIRRCLDSILQQSFPHFEIIVVNDGSTDSSKNVVDSYSDPRIRLVSQPNAGPGAARNRGSSLAQGRLLAFLDGDDAWQPSYLADSLAEMESMQPQAGGIVWGMRLFPSGETTEARWRSRGIPEGLLHVTPQTPLPVVLGTLANMMPSSIVMWREAFLALGGFYEKNRCLYAEDTWLWIRLLFERGAIFRSRALVDRFQDASELSRNLQGVRPIEPFLSEPEPLRAACPSNLRPLLEQLLRARALKTAAVYGYFGESARARDLLSRFSAWQSWTLPHWPAAMLAVTPLGSYVGNLHRLTRPMRG